MLFEHPLNERTRTLLRLSRLFRQLDRHQKAEDPWQTRAAVQALVDILAILTRADIKTELIKQLDQHATTLQQVALNPDVDQARLQRVLEDLARIGDRLHALTGQLGQRLRKDDFLNGVAQRLAIPGGSFEFDLPLFHHWLHRPAEERAAQLHLWRGELVLVEEAVELLLGLLRHASLFRQQLARDGLYQKSLDPQKPVEMIQVKLDPALGVYPEISGSKHRICIRFLKADLDHPGESCHRDLSFAFKACVL